MKAKINKRQTLISGKWLELENITYTDPNGQERMWEAVSRKNCCGAAAIIAILKPSNRLILVRQFRPPSAGYVIEFPAGLIDNGESPETTAARELTEETGYIGKVTEVTIQAHNSPGMSGEAVSLVFMEVDEKSPKNIHPETNFDDGEHIETFLVEMDKMAHFLNTRQKAGDLMDAKVMTFTQGLRTNNKKSY